MASPRTHSPAAGEPVAGRQAPSPGVGRTEEALEPPGATGPTAEPSADKLLPPLNPATTSESHAQDEGSVSITGFSNFSVNLSVDHDDQDQASPGPQSGASTSSASVSSSVYEFVQEHGRTFHKYKEGKYFLPNDEKEQNRLDLQHAISKFLLDGKLGLAPVKNPGHVLDLGTGTGIWAVEFAEQNPESQVLGTDLSPIQPEYVPANCRFEIDDIEDDWVYAHRFDYIHGRYLLPFIKKDWNVVFRDIYDNLNPGGWVELQETIIYFQSIDGSIEGTALQRWNALLLQGIQKTGRSATEALRCKNYLAEAGFVNLGEKKFAVPMNPWAKGKEQKAIGAMQMMNNLEGIDGITMTVFTRSLGWTPADVERLVADVKRDLQDRSIHAYITVLVAWGQKP